MKPSYRAKKLAVDVTLPAETNVDGLTVGCRVLLGGKELLRFDAAKPQAAGTLSLSKEWAAPPLWGPETFPLLQLVTELTTADGAVLDRVDTRFGFREIWAEGMDLKWNGATVKFASRPFLSAWGWSLGERAKREKIRETIQAAKLNGCNMLRHIYDPEHYADIADEEGIPMAQGGGQTIAGHSKQQIESDLFWDNVAKTGIELVKGLRNHPSIVQWYLSNEYYGESEPLNGKRLREYGDKILQVDNTRLVEFGCDLDLRGSEKIISTHYPVDLKGLREPDLYLPEAAYWRYFKDQFTPGMKVPAGMAKSVANVYAQSPITWGYKPIIVNECCWISFFNAPDGLTGLVGDKVYTSPLAVADAHDLANKWFSKGHRDAGVSAITLWTWITERPNQIPLPSIDINLLQQYNKFYSGTTVEYDVNLHRDIFNERELEFSWALMDSDRRAILSERKPLRFTSCELKREKIALSLPKVDAQRAYTLELALKDGAATCASTVLPITVYPSATSSFLTSLFSSDNGLKVSVKNRVAVFDPAGKTAKALAQILTTFTNVNELDRDTLSHADLLVIGEEQPADSLTKYKDVVADFAKAGGTVLILRQSQHPQILPAQTVMSSRQPSINFSFRSTHPLLRDISADELSYWNPGHKTGSMYYQKPKSGNVRVVVEAGGPKGLDYAGLLEFPCGKGSIICAQLDLVENYAANPVARKLWDNIIRFSEAPKEACAKAGFIGDPSGPTAKFLARLGTQFDVVTLPLNTTAGRPILLDASTPPDAACVKQLREFVDAGGALAVFNVTPESRNAVAEICGKQITLDNYTPTAWQGRAVRGAPSPLTAGVTNYELFWRDRPETEDYAQCFHSTNTVQAPIGTMTIEAQDSAPVLFPSYLACPQRGKGKILLCNLNLTCEEKSVKDHAKRIGSTLLTNLGVELEGEKTLKLPEGLAYIPLDISAVMNRSFVDEKDADGKGGWTDQGPDCDLRSFPMDKPVQTFNKVPFRIEKPNSCVVLNSKFRPGAPERADITVNRKADALFFLQSSAWTNPAHHGNYTVRYAEGGAQEIKLVGDVNLRDWAAKKPTEPFLNEENTFTKVAWTGPNVKFGQCSLFMMAWVNPSPEKTISSIEFSSRNIGIPVLVAITIGEKTKAAARVPSTAEQTAKAIELAGKAKTLAENGDAAGAEKLYLEAIAHAWDCSQAHLGLGYLKEQKGLHKEAVDVYENLLHLLPSQFEGYMRLGKCYERLDDFPKAVETYRRSLDVNINQPDVMKALDDAKKSLKP